MGLGGWYVTDKIILTDSTIPLLRLDWSKFSANKIEFCL